MSDPHRHHRPHTGAEPSNAEAPVKPGYPEHPEEAHPPGHLPGPATEQEASRGHGAAHAAHQEAAPGRHGAHAHHAAGDEHAGHDKHAGHSVEMFRDKFWLSLALTIPTVIWGHMLPRLTGWHAPMFPRSEWIAPVFGTVVFFYGGWVFLQGAVRELKDRLPGMMTLISLAITVAFVFSAAVTLGYPGMPLWEEVATLSP
jgi:P-type Cu2+ transporter